jgi:hypothetical protein
MNQNIPPTIEGYLSNARAWERDGDVINQLFWLSLVVKDFISVGNYAMAKKYAEEILLITQRYHLLDDERRAWDTLAQIAIKRSDISGLEIYLGKLMEILRKQIGEEQDEDVKSELQRKLDWYKRFLEDELGKKTD